MDRRRSIRYDDHCSEARGERQVRVEREEKSPREARTMHVALEIVLVAMAVMMLIAMLV